MHSLIKFVLLVVAWLLWSGSVTRENPLVAVFGAVSCLAVTLLTRRLDASCGSRPLDVALALRSVLYLPWLVIEIVKANFAVAKIILAPSLPISPRLIRTEAGQRSELGQVIHANSITLTPGTVTLDVRDGRFLVHALTQDAADGVLDGQMDRRISRLEGGS